MGCRRKPRPKGVCLIPRQNRVNPFGSLVVTPERGALMGNRGCLHDNDGIIRRVFAHKAWVTCQVEWKGVQRKLFSPGRYSELFFLDEATAFAAGHRPCNYCRRDDYKAFNLSFSNALASGSNIKAGDMDLQIHSDRMNKGRVKKTFRAELSSLPDGLMVVLAGSPDTPRMLWNGNLLRWSFDGYSDPLAAKEFNTVDVLTPASICAVLAAGYPVKVHPSASITCL